MYLDFLKTSRETFYNLNKHYYDALGKITEFNESRAKGYL